MVGERVEILVNLADDKPGSTLDLMSYNANQPFGFPGGEDGSGPPNGSYLNNRDFRVLHINVGQRTAKPVLEIPKMLTTNDFPKVEEASKERQLYITADRPGDPFGFDKKLFAMDRIDHVVKLGAVEKWTITNNRIFGHSFHIHDVQFKIISRSNVAVQEWEKGWKDTLYVPRDQSVTFIAKFEDFASDEHAFMYHCHMANHEDGGLMGQFLVSKKPDSATLVFRERMAHPLTKEIVENGERVRGTIAPDFSGTDTDGKPVSLSQLAKEKPVVLFFIEPECPCARDAAPFLARIQKFVGSESQVIGVVKSDASKAREWSKLTGVNYPILADPQGKVISSFKVTSAGSVAVITPGGTIQKVYPGYSQATLQEIYSTVTSYAKASKLTKDREFPYSSYDEAGDSWFGG
jgi:peroxiredoxin